MAPVVRPGVRGEAAGGGRPGEEQEVETLEVGRIQPDPPGDRVAHQHRLRAHLPQHAVECVEQVGAAARGRRLRSSSRSASILK